MTALEDQPVPRPGIDRRRFLGAMTAAAVGADAVAASTSSARRRVAGPFRASSQPNILVIVVDELRSARWFGAGSRGEPQLPPAIARLASHGVSFERHYTASNDCSPARSTLVTGLHTHQTGVMITGDSTLDPAFPTWGRMLREQGYGAWWFGKWHLTSDDRFWTPADGPAALARYGFEGGTFPSPNGAPGQGWRMDGTIADQFASWYAGAAGDEPWCTTVSFVNPHDIAWWWRWSARYVPEASAPPVVGALPPNFETPAQLRARNKPRVQLSLQDTSAASFGEVAFEGPLVVESWLPFLDLYVKLQMAVDHHIERVLRALASRPAVMANTVVVFTSDHGEYGASHGLRGKGAGVYEEGIRVPLVLTDYSGGLQLVPGTRQQLSSSVDVAPLLLTIATGSNEWRSDPHYAQIANRADLLGVAQDPDAPGRAFALHATDEVITEFALLPYAADAPLHIAALITPTQKYATYSNWRPGTLMPTHEGTEAELYDNRTRGGMLEVDNLAGASADEERLQQQLQEAILTELRAPLSGELATAHLHGINQYHALAAAAHTTAAVHRMNKVEAIVREIEDRLP